MSAIQKAGSSRRLMTGVVSLVGASAMLLTGCAGGTTSEQPGEEPAESGGIQMNQEIHDMLPAKVQESGELIVGTEAYYPPYSFYDEDDNIVGLDHDLTRAIGEVFGVKVSVENMAWDGLLPALDAKRFEMVNGGIGINPDRLQKFDMVSFYDSSQGITVTAENPKGIESRDDLCGLNVSVLEASYQLTLLEDMNADQCSSSPINILAFPSDSDALQQLQNGRADAHVSQYPVAAYNAQNFGNGEIFTTIEEPAFGPYMVGFVFRKGDTEMSGAVQAAMNELIETGVYQEILKSNGLEGGAIETSEVNPE